MTDSPLKPLTIAFIGFGEAAIAFTDGWREDPGLGDADLVVKAYDIKTADPALRPNKLADYAARGVKACNDVKSAVSDCDAIFSLVTADQSTAVTNAVAPHLANGTVFFDGNSCSPGTKQRNAGVISAQGGHYLDLAIMSPVYPKRHKTPLLLSGKNVSHGLTILEQLHMHATGMGDDVGQASAIKMIRSVMVKGMEALTAECVLAARKAGVDKTVLASLQQTFPEIQWAQRSAYNLERMMLHGGRRAKEMQEVATTLKEMGIDNSMTKACSNWQESIGELQLAADSTEYSQLADKILANLKQPR